MTQAQFLNLYRIRVSSAYAWANDPAKLDRFMAAVAETLEGKSKAWDHTGQSVVDVWKMLGGKGKPTLKALRALPKE